MAQDGGSPSRVSCPSCRQVSVLPAGSAEGLPNNLHALLIIRLINEKKNEQYIKIINNFKDFGLLITKKDILSTGLGVRLVIHFLNHLATKKNTGSLI